MDTTNQLIVEIGQALKACHNQSPALYEQLDSFVVAHGSLPDDLLDSVIDFVSDESGDVLSPDERAAAKDEAVDRKVDHVTKLVRNNMDDELRSLLDELLSNQPADVLLGMISESERVRKNALDSDD